MNEFLNNLKKQASENPLFALATIAGAAQAAARLLNTNTQRKKAKSWDKEVNRRIKKSS